MRCGAFTGWVRWAYEPSVLRDAGRPQPLDPRAASPDDAAGDGGSGGGGGDACVARCCAACAPAAGLRHAAVVLNARLFDGRPPVAVLDAASLPRGRSAAAAALGAALAAAKDGDTIELRGTFRLRDSPGLSAGVAVRLVGASASRPYSPVHHNPGGGALAADAPYFERTVPPGRWPNTLLGAERAASAALGFPSARLHAEGSLCADGPVWLQSLCLSRGDETVGRHGIDAAGGDCDWGPAVSTNFGAADHAAQPVVLDRCWVTGFEGTGVCVGPGGRAALLRCAITNCAGCSVMAWERANVRMRGCHVACNMSLVSAVRYADDTVARAAAAANRFFDNYGGGSDFPPLEQYGSEGVLLLT